MKNRKLFSFFDIILALIICAVGAAFLTAPLIFNGGGGLTAVIRVNSEIYKEIELSAVSSAYELKIDGAQSVILLIDKNSVSFKESDCRDKICVNSGKLTKSGESAVCLPAKVSVTLRGSKKDETDGVLR